MNKVIVQLKYKASLMIHFFMFMFCFFFPLIQLPNGWLYLLNKFLLSAIYSFQFKYKIQFVMYISKTQPGKIQQLMSKF